MTRLLSRAGRGLPADWRDAGYCAVDVETTGLDLRRDSIVSVGVAPVSQGRIVGRDTYYSLVRAACPVSVAATRVHCLRPADLEHAPAAEDVARELAGRLDGRILVAHAAWIERAFLGRLLRLVKVRLAAPVIDTAALARALGHAEDVPPGVEPSLELAGPPPVAAGIRAASRARRRGHDRGGVPRPGHQGRARPPCPPGPWSPGPPSTGTNGPWPPRLSHSGTGPPHACMRNEHVRAKSTLMFTNN